MGLLITNLTMAIPSAIFQEAFLSYIGLGISPPQASWGVLAKEGTRMMTQRRICCTCRHSLSVQPYWRSTSSETVCGMHLTRD